MKVLAEFTKTTLIGGVLVILPIYIAVLLLAKAVKGLLALLTPVTAQLPAGVQFRQVAAIPFTKALSVFTKWGTGAGEYVRAMKQTQCPPALTDPSSTAPVANLDGSFRDPG